ncbi:MAG: hypothetical protein AMJ88_00875 [Anaerolineae bacterium SM23_ 63]|nr:MAG: hypothetical protein AMJ88_00875 [Anaerolineae bacterium SM23_ 63]HEY47914.1 DUF167 domain-containing protein [Anaerolineae bacterium]
MRRYKLHNGQKGAALTIRVTPRSRKTEFGGVMEDGTIRVRVAAPPVEGKANTALVKFLAKVLGVRMNRIDIVAGEKGLDKIISILDMSAEDAEQRIQGFLGEE